MDNKAEQNPDTASGSSALNVMSPDERKIQAERLKRSVRVTKTFLRAIQDYKKLLHRLSAPFLEKASEKDSQKKISARKNRQRDAVFLTAKDALAPDHPVRKSIEESLRSLDNLDAAIISNAQNIKEKIVEKLDALINHALKEAEKQPSTEAIEHFVQTVQDLNREIDLRLAETAQLHKKSKAELRQAWIRRLVTTKNIAIVAAILIADIIATVGYMIMTQEKTPAPDIAEPADIKEESQLKKVTSAHSDKTSSTSKTVATSTTTVATQNKIADSKLITTSSQNTSADTKAVDGKITLLSGQDPETMKKNVHALGDAIRAWNAENAAQSSAEKTKDKK